MSEPARIEELVPPLEGSALALSLLHLEPGASIAVGDSERESLLFVQEGSGGLDLGGDRFELDPGSAGLVLAEEAAALSAGVDGLECLRATVGPGTDRHALLGPRETVARLGGTSSERAAVGSRSYRVLFGPKNGSERATLFVGYLPPGRSPWHYHLYDEIVWVPEGPGRLHLEGSETPLDAGAAFRLRPRQVHIVENASEDRDLVVVGVFTPAGSPSAAYLPR